VQSDPRPPGPAPSLSSGESESSAGTVATIKPSIEVQKDSNDAQQITAVVPKKPSDADRKEAVRKQAIDSFHSGQQLIRESRNAEAMQALKQAVKLAPESADAWLRIAFLLEREGKLEEARRAFKEAKRFWSF
jgi:Flp pilus assembly protein TadD